jgi:hypothetical protein
VVFLTYEASSEANLRLDVKASVSSPSCIVSNFIGYK